MSADGVPGAQRPRRFAPVRDRWAARK